MRKTVLAGFLVAAVACGPRQAEVRTAPTLTSGPSLQVANTLPQPVNVYVTLSGTDTFLGQIPAKTNQNLSVPGFAPGTSVNLKAVTVDGTHTYARNDVTLSAAYPISIP